MGLVAAPVRILLIDDHGLFADALTGVLQRLGGEVRVQTVGSCEAALPVLEQGRFELVLLDLQLPGLKGRSAFDAVHARAGGAAVVIVTGSEPTAAALEMLRAGARGYVHKRSSGEELLKALGLVLDGGTHVPRVVLEAAATERDDVRLTSRQREVLALLAKGESNREIAQALGISEATVRVHVSSVMRALDVENRTQAATSAYGRRLADEE